MKRAIAYYIFIILSWIGAWLLYEKVNLESQSSLTEFIYWTIAKIIIWILPILLVTKYVAKETVSKYLGLVNWKQGLRAGAVIGLIFIGLSFLLDIFFRGFTLPQISIGFLSAVLLAPLLEEIVFRGYILGAMEKDGHSFWLSNLLTAIFFLGIHLPGWYFMGSTNLTQPLLISSIILIGIIAGYAKKHSDSTWGSITLHFINNLYSSFIR